MDIEYLKNHLKKEVEQYSSQPGHVAIAPNEEYGIFQGEDMHLHFSYKDKEGKPSTIGFSVKPDGVHPVKEMESALTIEDAIAHFKKQLEQVPKK